MTAISLPGLAVKLMFSSVGGCSIAGAEVEATVSAPAGAALSSSFFGAAFQRKVPFWIWIAATEGMAMLSLELNHDEVLRECRC